MADETRGEILIATTVERVAQVVADLAGYPKWTDGMGTPTVLERDEAGLPLVAEFEVTAGPVKDRVRLSYRWSETQVEWRLLQATALKALNGVYKWAPEAGGVKVVYELQLDLSKSLPTLVRKMAEKAIITNALQGLKRQAEAGN